MLMYLLIIFISLGIIMVVNGSLSHFGLIDYSIRYVVLATLIMFMIVFLINTICVCVPRYICPKRMMNPERKIYKVYKWEAKLYNKLSINKWKDKIPELGCLAGFVKTSVQSTDDPSYLFKFAEETVYAEVMHISATIFSWAILLIPPYDLMFNITFWIALVSSGLNVLPTLVQRYNRPRLLRMYYRELKIKQRVGKNYEKA